LTDENRSDPPPGPGEQKHPERRPAGWPDPPPPRGKQPAVKPDPAQETLPLDAGDEPDIAGPDPAEPPAVEAGAGVEPEAAPPAPAGADPAKPVPPPARDPAARAVRPPAARPTPGAPAPAPRPVKPAPGTPGAAGPAGPPRPAQPAAPAEPPPARALRGLDLAEWWRRLSPEQRAAGIGSLLLIVSTFGPFSFVEAAIVLIAGAILLLLRKRAGNAIFHLPFGDGSVIAAAGLWSALLIVVRMFDRPLGQGLLALVCAAILVLAGIRERSKRPADDAPTARLREQRDRDATAPTQRI